MIEILLESTWFLVINTPSGILTQAVAGIDSVQSLLVKQLQERDSGAPTPFVGIPHRLDRATSGAMVVPMFDQLIPALLNELISVQLIPDVDNDPMFDQLIPALLNVLMSLQLIPRRRQ